MKINGTVKYGYGVPYQDYSPSGTYYNSGTQLASGSFTIYHNNDGTGSFSVDVGGCLQYSYWYMNPSYRGYGQADTGNWNTKGSTSITLDAIPRNPATISATVSNTKYESNTYVVGGYSTSTITVSATMGDAPSITKYIVKRGTEVLKESASSPISFTVPNVSGNSQSITYTVQAIDSYGLYSNVYTCTAFTAYKYTPGGFTSAPLSQRCLNDGTLDEEGQYAKCQISFQNSKIGTNNITTTCKATISSYSGQTTTSPLNVVIGNGSLAQSSSYTVTYSLSDALGNNFITSTDTISVSFHTANFHSTGRSVAFGQAATAPVNNKGFFDVSNMTFRIDRNELVDLIYPVGAIYMSVNSTNPSTLLGGTWVRITDTFLYCGTDSGTYEVGQSGGSKNSVAKHSHQMNGATMIWTGSGNTAYPGSGTAMQSCDWQGGTYYDGQTGIDDGNMPPWLSVYVWKRTA